MRPATTNLINFLAANTQFVTADLWTFAPVGGSVLRYVDYPISIGLPATSIPGSQLNTTGMLTWLRGIRIGRSKTSLKVGMQPTEMDVFLYPRSDDLIGALTWQSFAESGGFDGASVELDRMFMTPGLDGIRGPLDMTLGAIVWFFGRVADLEIGRSRIVMKVKSLFILLEEQQMPRRVYQAACTHIFGDTMCGYDRVGGKNAAGVATGLGQVTITALTGSDQHHVLTSFAPSPSTAYDQGTITGVTGANAGVKRTTATLSGGSLVVYIPFTGVVNAGDTFNILPGCAHTVAVCNGTLNNYARYGGFPFIPPPEQAI